MRVRAHKEQGARHYATKPNAHKRARSQQTYVYIHGTLLQLTHSEYRCYQCFVLNTLYVPTIDKWGHVEITRFSE